MPQAPRPGNSLSGILPTAAAGGNDSAAGGGIYRGAGWLSVVYRLGYAGAALMVRAVGHRLKHIIACHIPLSRGKDLKSFRPLFRVGRVMGSARGLPLPRACEPVFHHAQGVQPCSSLACGLCPR